MKRFVTGCWVLLVLSGCVSTTAPADNLNFSDNANLRSFSGVFENVGTPKINGFTVYLSGILWPDRYKKGPPLDGYADRIQVQINDKQVEVSAVRKGCVAFSKRYQEGKDFILKDGRIELKSRASLINNVLVGPAYESVTLGLDTHGDGKYEYVGGGAGMAFLIIPYAGAERHDVRFKRLSVAPVHLVCHN